MTTIRDLVTQLGSNDRATATQSIRKLADAVDRATSPSASLEREALATALAAELVARSDAPDAKPEPTNVPGTNVKGPVFRHSVEARRYVCRFLNQVASDSQLPALAEALEELDVRDSVRCVLECIPTPRATAALVAALKQVGPEFRVGVINALAKKRWPEAMVALQGQTNDPDGEVRLAAVEGLAHFPEAELDQSIVAATKNGTPWERARA